MGILELKKYEVKSLLARFNSRIEINEEKVSDLEDRSIEFTKFEDQKLKKNNKKLMKVCLSYLVSEGQDKEVDAKNIFEEEIARGTLNLMKNTVIDSRSLVNVK